MKSIYVVHVLTGVLLIGALVIIFELKDSSSGSSGVISITRSSDSDPAALQPMRAPRAALTFIDQRGKPVSEMDFRGKYALVFFGYTRCPDVCPLNLSVMAHARRLLGEDRARVTPIFISFDPERDTPEVLQRYVSQFDSEMVALTGSPDEIAAATRAYGVYYKVSSRAASDPSRFDFEHSSQTYLIDPEGQAVALFPHDSDPSQMADEIRRRLAAAASKRVARSEPIEASGAMAK